MTKRLSAYRISNKTMDIVPAPLRRDWMDDTPGSHAYKCLPLDIANQHGWLLMSPGDIIVRWNGGAGHKAVTVTGAPDDICQSHFGHGIITFEVPYLFRTEKGYNLHVTGVPNYFRDGLQNLEGIIETDWAPQTFSVNLKLTRANHDVLIAKNTPFARIAPVKRAEIEEFAPDIREISEDGELAEEHARFVKKRHYTYSVNARLRDAGLQKRYDQDYFRGETVTGKTRHPEHQTKLRLRPFRKT